MFWAWVLIVVLTLLVGLLVLLAEESRWRREEDKWERGDQS